MCGNNGMCFGGNGLWWIIILILLCNCGGTWGGNWGGCCNDCDCRTGNNNCGCNY